jgi:hypothetical protein
VSAAGWNGDALVRDLHRPNIETAFKTMAERELGIPWEEARDMTFVVFCAALAAARRKKVA